LVLSREVGKGLAVTGVEEGEGKEEEFDKNEGKGDVLEEKVEEEEAEQLEEWKEEGEEEEEEEEETEEKEERGKWEGEEGKEE